MGGLEETLEAALEAKGHRHIRYRGHSDHQDLAARSHIFYTTDTIDTKNPVSIKLIPKSRLQGRKISPKVEETAFKHLDGFLHSITSFELSVDGRSYWCIVSEQPQDKAVLDKNGVLLRLDEESILKTLVQYTRILEGAHRRGIAHGDTKAANVLVDVYSYVPIIRSGRRLNELEIEAMERSVMHSGDNPMIIDHSSAQVFGELLLEGSVGYVHPLFFDQAVPFAKRGRVASENTDGYAFIKMAERILDDRANHAPFKDLYELSHRFEDKPDDPDLDISMRRLRRILLTPTMTRRAFLSASLIAAASAADFIKAKEGYMRSPSGVRRVLDGQRGAHPLASQQLRGIGEAAARKTGSLVERGFFSTSPQIANVPGRYDTQGELEIEIYHFEGGANTKQLYLAASVDPRALPAARAHTAAQIASAESIGFRKAADHNMHVSPLLLAYKDKKDLAALSVILQAADALITQSRFESRGRLFLPYVRPDGDEELPVVLAADTRSLDVLLAANTARQLARRDGVLEYLGLKEEMYGHDYAAMAQEFCQTLRELVVGDVVYNTKTYIVNPPKLWKVDCLAHARVAKAFWEVGALAHDTELLGESQRLLDVILSLGYAPKTSITSGDPDTYSRIMLCRVAQLQQRPLLQYEHLLYSVIDSIPAAHPNPLFWNDTKEDKKELFGGVCLKMQFPPDAWCNVGTPPANADGLELFLSY